MFIITRFAFCTLSRGSTCCGCAPARYNINIDFENTYLYHINICRCQVTLWEISILILKTHILWYQYLTFDICQDSGQCTCEHVEPGQRVCSSLIEVDNPGIDQVGKTFTFVFLYFRICICPLNQVFPWCRGRSQPTPHPKIDSPVIQHCPAQVSWRKKTWSKVVKLFELCIFIQIFFRAAPNHWSHPLLHRSEVLRSSRGGLALLILQI